MRSCQIQIPQQNKPDQPCSTCMTHPPPPPLFPTWVPTSPLFGFRSSSSNRVPPFNLGSKSPIWVQFILIIGFASYRGSGVHHGEAWEPHCARGRRECHRSSQQSNKDCQIEDLPPGQRWLLFSSTNRDPRTVSPSRSRQILAGLGKGHCQGQNIRAHRPTDITWEFLCQSWLTHSCSGWGA